MRGNDKVLEKILEDADVMSFLASLLESRHVLEVQCAATKLIMVLCSMQEAKDLAVRLHLWS
jgi:hypothetical protein